MALFIFRNILRKLVERWELLAPIEGDVRLKGKLLFQTDNTYDIGTAGDTRPRDVYIARIIALGSYIDGIEIADPAAPDTNHGRVYFRDTGGKTELVVRFPTGAIQQIAIEP